MQSIIMVCGSVCVGGVYGGTLVHHFSASGIRGPCAPSGAICTTEAQFCLETCFFLFRLVGRKKLKKWVEICAHQVPNRQNVEVR